MGHGAFSTFKAVVASGTSLSSELDLGRSWVKVYIDPAGAGAEIQLQAAGAASGSVGGTYRTVLNASAAAATDFFKVPTATSGGLVPAPSGLRYIKVALSAAAGNGATINLVCAD